MCQGAWENYLEGTRQIDLVTSGEEGPKIKFFSNNDKVICPMLKKKLNSRAQKIGDSDCLVKTQVSANLKKDVLGLTPARCCKVN